MLKSVYKPDNIELMFRCVYILKVWWSLNVKSECYDVPEGSI